MFMAGGARVVQCMAAVLAGRRAQAVTVSHTAAPALLDMQDGQDASAPVQAPNMLWLIQRDFLQGKTVQAMVTEALAEVPNPSGNPDIAQVRQLLL